MAEHSVVIAGGRPARDVGGQAGLAGIDVAIVERRPSQVLLRLARKGRRHPHDRGPRSAWIADRFLIAGVAQVAVRDDLLDISDFPTAPLRARAVAGAHRAHLAGWVGELQR